VLVVADAVLVASEVGLALLLGRPCALALWLFGPLFFGATLALIAWWHTRGPGAVCVPYPRPARAHPRRGS
jgi:hypothetical protein